MISLVMAAFIPYHSQAGSEEVPLELVDHLERTIYLNAGESAAFYFDPIKKEIKTDPSIGDLPAVVYEALNRTPGWVRENLTILFHRLPESYRETYARLILNCPEERYLDELTFSIAHTPVEVLTSNQVYPEVFLRNVEQLYSNDRYIDYADIVDYDDYSTLRYWVNSSGERVSHLLPREIYYWYVVHPKLTDEVPTLIDPSTGRPSPSGYFWRDYLFNHADPSYPPDTSTSTVLYPKATPPLLKDLLSGVETLWNLTSYRAPGGYLDNGTGNRRPFTYGDHAIERVSNWVEKTLPLNVREESKRIDGNPERSIQPVRIAHNHYGNCGELQDLTIAAARAALIPTRGVLNTGEDHVWCEFWERGWHHWDNYWSDGGTAVDNFHNYDADYPGSWGRELSAVFAWRGDDYIWTVTDKYTPTAEYTAEVVDSSGVPLDGATVVLATENFYNPDYLTIACWGETDLSGKAHFLIGDDRNYWGEANCRLGQDPPNSGGSIQVRSIITSSEAGRSYTSTYHIPGALPQPEATLVEGVRDGKYLLKVNYTVESAIMHSKNFFTGNTWCRMVEDGKWIDFYLTTSRGYSDFKGGRPFEALNITERSGGGELICRITDDDLYYAVFSNLRTLSTDRCIRVNVTVYYIPSVVITSPSSGSRYVHTEIVEITGTAASFAGVERVEWSIDGGEWEEAESTTADWSHFRIELDTTPLSQGEHRIDVRAVTVEGGMVYTSLLIYVYDSIFPGLNITSPQSGQEVVQGEALRVEGYCWDDYMVERLRLRMDGGEWVNITSSMDVGGRWSAEVPTEGLEVGEHTVEVEATDSSSHTSTASVEVYVTERVPPVVNITSPENGTFFPGGGSVLISGTVHDNWRLSSLMLYLDGERLKAIRTGPEGGEWECTLSTAELPDGPHTVKAVAEDSEGNMNSSSVTFFVDSTPPDISLIYPTEMVRVGPTGNLTVRVHVSDNFLVTEVYTTLDGREYPAVMVEEGEWISYINLSSLSGGRHRFMVRACDEVGLEATTSGSFILDATPPEILLAPFSNTFYVGERVYINGSIFDLSGIDSLIVVVNGNEVNITNTIIGGVWSYAWETASLTPGNYTVTIVGRDCVGNTATVSVTLTLLERAEEHLHGETAAEGGHSHLLPVVLASVAAAVVAALILFMVRRRGGEGVPNPPGGEKFNVPAPQAGAAAEYVGSSAETEENLNIPLPPPQPPAPGR